MLAGKGGVFWEMDHYPPSPLLDSVLRIGNVLQEQMPSNAYFLPGIANALENLGAIAENIGSILEHTLPFEHSGVHLTAAELGVWVSDLQSCVAADQSDLLQSLADSLTLSDSYMTEEIREKCEEIPLPQSKKVPGIRLTLSDILSILSLLITIYFGILPSMPSEQAERIIAQNEVIIERQNEIVQLKKENKTLLDALDSLSNSINLLTDEVELLREELECSNDSPDSSSQSDTEDTYQQNCDAQD